ncbi:MAG: YqgE/AlgH family protein [Deltaproteobacteria bacterium]|nr:YqgE/AlgH family protein [Deltaproteobacteria bacterium]
MENPFNPLLLVAVPQLVDPYFRRSVILVLQHTQDGAFGLVLNQSTHFSLREFAHNQSLVCHPNFYTQAVFRGGPVEPYRGFILHNHKSIIEKQEIIPGVFVSGSNESLNTLLTEGEHQLRFLLGYAGWDGTQLEKEMAEGSWIAIQLDAKYIFYQNHEDLWDATLHDIGINPMSLAQGTGIH